LGNILGAEADNLLSRAYAGEREAARSKGAYAQPSYTEGHGVRGVMNEGGWSARGVMKKRKGPPLHQQSKAFA